MNRGETLALWKQGPEAWNAWAREMLNRPDKGTNAWSREALADFVSFKPSSKMNCSGLIFPGRADFSSCVFQNSCDFEKATFHGDACFTEAEFLYPASFIKAEFLHDAFLDKCKFYDGARFERCLSKGFFNFCNSVFYDVAGFNNSKIYMAQFINTEFSKGARFFDCVFTSTAAFSRSTFERVSFSRSLFVRQANFEHAHFTELANFAEVDFQGATSFGSGVFVCRANFEAASIERSFDMAGAIFEKVPNFIQAHFAEAPRLDNVIIGGRKSPTNGSPDAGKDGDELPARWRALKRLALQGYDHVREQEYFAEELKALKHNDEKCVSNSAIWLYEHLSDYGRSMLRPLAAWALLTLLFWWLYLLMHFAALQDNTVTFHRHRLQIPPGPLRPHYVKAQVKVRQYLDGTFAVFHGPREIGRYDAGGALQTQTPEAGVNRFDAEPNRGPTRGLDGQPSRVAHNSTGPIATAEAVNPCAT